ncbi:hypothetical protein [Planctomicrobium piriforme]|uniref:Uncharacterized protein n=1 Tax=Planctomicrobium piriforme TaxID=1576369 RepID=A0A1I3L420_9PLAN|nr:hypothetical protein [Planctomicrobium piriforme]SFI79326.1 hypothetical protein SAMN05421753_112129 [Planctomicrobium piriforme]
MIRTAQAPESEETDLSLEQLAAILKTHFEDDATIHKQDGDDRLSISFSRCISRMLTGSVPLSLSNVLRTLAGQCLAAAQAIDTAGGYSEELEFFECSPAHTEIGLIGIAEEVTFNVANVNSPEEAIARVQQSLALLGLGKQPPRPQRQTSRAARPEGSGTHLVKSYHSEHRFWLGSDEFTNVDICVWNESDEGNAMALAERFVEFLQAQKPRRRRLTA